MAPSFPDYTMQQNNFEWDCINEIVIITTEKNYDHITQGNRKLSVLLVFVILVENCW